MIASNLITVVQGATINLLAAYLQDQFGNPMTQNGLAVLVADAGTNGFLDPQPSFPLSVGASWGADDRIVGLWNLTASGEDGFLYDQTVALYTAGVAAGQQLQLYWFPSLTLASNTVGVTYYGKYTDTNSPPRDGSAPWNLPAVGANVELVFFIQSVGGSNPDETGLATNLTTVPLSADFTANPTNGLTPLTVAYTDTTTGSPTNWVWNFGDGDSSTLQNPSHTYSTSGVYTVQLIGSGAGSSSTNVKTAFISVSPAALQSWSNLYGVPADSADADGDGMINTNEFLAGFNPTNSDASLAILSLTTQATNVVIRYRASNGDNSYLGGPLSRTNVLEYTLGASGWYSTNFASTGWTNILNGGSGTGAVVDATDTNGATSTPARYYRVRVLLP
jgi:PKD repeat protein